MPDYKRKQMEIEDQLRPRYSLEPIHFTPVEQFYAEREYHNALTLLNALLPLPAEPIKTILVGGVGAGADLHYWLTHLPLQSAVGLDFSKEAIKASQRRIQLNNLPSIVEFVQADFENIPLSNNSIDLGIFVHTLHHALDPQQGFRELWRVSRRGVLLIEPLATPVTHLLARLGIARDVEDVGNKVIRFSLPTLLPWTGEECTIYRSRSCLSYYHPLIYQHILPLFNSRPGLALFKSLYTVADRLLFPLHSKMVALLLKSPAK